MFRILSKRRSELGRLLGFICVQDQAAANNRCGLLQTGQLSELFNAYLPRLACSAHYHTDIGGHLQKSVLNSKRTETFTWVHLNSAWLENKNTLTSIQPGLVQGEFRRNYATSSNPGGNEADSNLKDSKKGSARQDEDQVEKVEEGSKGIIQRFKDAYKEYGKVLICVHVATSTVWFGSFYYAAYSGIDVIPILKSLGASERVMAMFQKAGVGNIAVAYLLYKLATPARYTVTIGGTHWVVRALRSRGFMEQVPEGDRIRDLMRDSREHVQLKVKDKYDDVQVKVKDKYDDVQLKVKDKYDDFKDDVKEKKVEWKEKVTSKPK